MSNIALVLQRAALLSNADCARLPWKRYIERAVVELRLESRAS